MDATAIFALLGGIGLFVALFGGGIEAEKIKIPNVSGKYRIFSGIVGIVLIGISVWLSVLPNQAIQLPQATLEVMSTQSNLSVQGGLTILDGFNEPKFNEQKWSIESNTNGVMYTVAQNGGKACLEFVSQSPQEIPIRSKFPGLIDIVEADINYVSGEGSFGLDIWDEYEWNNLLMDNSGALRIEYAKFTTDQETTYPIPNVNCCSGIHKLAVKYNQTQIDYFFDDVLVLSRPTTGTPLGYGFDVRTNANSNLNVCVDEIRVHFIK